MENDLSALERMAYAGRGIIVGHTEDDNLFFAYFITEREPSSQARKLIYGEKTGVISTAATDLAELSKGSPALLLYPAIIPSSRAIIIGSGVQTNIIHSLVEDEAFNLPAERILGKSFVDHSLIYDSHEDRFVNLSCYEPDEPNYTPRISACISGGSIAFCMVRSDDGRNVYKLFPLDCKLRPGEAKMITTYAGGNESPLKPFESEPLDLKIGAIMPGDIAKTIYDASKGSSGEDYRVAAAAVVEYKRNGKLFYDIVNRCEGGMPSSDGNLKEMKQ